MTLAASLISHFIRAGVETRLITIPATNSMTGGEIRDSASAMRILTRCFISSRESRRRRMRTSGATFAGSSDDPFLIVIASASRAPHLNARAAEFITLEEL